MAFVADASTFSAATERANKTTGSTLEYVLQHIARSVQVLYYCQTEHYDDIPTPITAQH